MKKVTTSALQAKAFEVLYSHEKKVGQFPAKSIIHSQEDNISWNKIF